MQDGCQSAILNPFSPFPNLIFESHNIFEFEDDRTKNVDCRVFTRNFRIQDGRQSAILDPIFTIFELDQDFMVIHNISEFEDDRTKNVDCREFTRKVTDGRTHARQTTTKTQGYSISPIVQAG